MSDDPTLDALDDLLAVGRMNISTWMQVFERVELVRARRQAGADYTAIQLPEGERLIDALAANQQRLGDVVSRLRRESMLQLRLEGWSAADIGRAFGVSRQLVSRMFGELDSGATQVDENPPHVNGH